MGLCKFKKKEKDNIGKRKLASQKIKKATEESRDPIFETSLMKGRGIPAVSGNGDKSGVYVL